MTEVNLSGTASAQVPTGEPRIKTRLKFRLDDGKPGFSGKQVLGYQVIRDDVVIPKIGESVRWDKDTYSVLGVWVKNPLIIEVLVKKQEAGFISRIFRR